MIPSPAQRRAASFTAAGILGAAALREASLGSLSSANYLAIGGSAALLLPTLIRNCSWFGPIVTRFPTVNREVWLTIDDGPNPNDTPEILDVLSRYEARATFFGIGKRIQTWPHLALAIRQAGHQLQNHTFSHPAGSFWATLPNRAKKEICGCSDMIKSVTGVQSTQFRAPAGLANPFLHAAVEHSGMRMIGWSATGLDGIPHNPDRVIERIMHAVVPGSIILIHEGPLPGHHQGTRAKTLEFLLKRLHSKGYRTVIPSL